MAVDVLNGYVPVNELGEWVMVAGAGSANVVGTLPEGFIPVDRATGKIIAVGIGGGGGSYTLPVSSPSILGGVKVDNSSVVVNGAGVISAVPYSPPTASTTVLGQVKVDGTTVTINSSTGVISAVGGGGSSKQASTGTLANATPVVVALAGAANAIYKVAVNPTTGDTIRVESGTSSTGPWTAWTNGDVTAADSADLYPSSPANTHVRFTRVSGAGTTSRYYINEQ